MKTLETGILKKSDILFSTPSDTAKRLYYYPLSAGHFYGVKGYSLKRDGCGSLLIMHVIKGAFTFAAQDVRVSAQAGETVVLDCFNPHEYCADKAFESVWVHFAGLNCRELCDEIVKSSGNVIKCSDPDHVKKLLLHITDGMSGKKPTSEMQYSFDIYAILTELSAPSYVSRKERKRYEEQVREIKKYIADNLHESLSVKGLADYVHMSESHFSRVFKRQTGVTPYYYILTARLNRAKEYLQKTDMTITEIAYETGFNSESNFIYFFTSHSGMSPMKFRKLKF